MLNLKVRVKQQWFWLTLIPLVFLFIDQLCSLVQQMSEITAAGQIYQSQIMDLALRMVTTAFSILALIGFPVDTTTEGYADSARVMTYDEPAMNAVEYGKVSYMLDNEMFPFPEEEEAEAEVAEVAEEIASAEGTE